MVSFCAGCNGKIHDKYLMKVLDKTWHSECLTCGECGAALADKCFTKDGKFYCKTDFYKQQAALCSGCRKPISATDLILRPHSGGAYHVHCFTCAICCRLLSAGEEFYTLPNNRFICKKDYNAPISRDNEVHSTTGTDNTSAAAVPELNHAPPSWSAEQIPHQISAHQQLSPQKPTSPLALSPHGVVSTTVHESPNSDAKPESSEDCDKTKLKESQEFGSSEVNSNADSPETSSSQVSTTTGKRRGPRTTIKSKQLEILKDAFNSTPKPTRNIREQLATKTGLNMRVIQVWFQNRRSKERRMKQMNLSNRGRYVNPLSRELSEEYGYPQDHFFRHPGSECYYGAGVPDQGFMQCLQLPMDTAAGHSRTLDHEPWSRLHYDTPGPAATQLGAMISGAGYPPLSSTWSGAVAAPDSTNQIAFQT